MRGWQRCVVLLMAALGNAGTLADDETIDLFAPAVRQMIEEIDHPDPRLRASHAESFSGFPEAIHFLDSIVPALLRLVADPHPDVRAKAIVSLGKHVGRIDPNAEVEAALQAATRDPQAQVRRAGVGALARFERGHDEGCRALRGALADTDPQVRGEAMRIAAELFEPAELALAVAAGVRDTEPAVRRQAVATAAAGLEPTVAYATLFAALDDPEPSVWVIAGEALMKLWPGAPKAAIGQALRHPSADVRSLVGEVFSRLAAAAREAKAVHRAIHPLAPFLIETLADASPEARAWSATALGELRIETGASLRALTSALADPAPDLRRAASASLAAFRPTDPSTRSALVEAVGDPLPFVATQALRALRSTENDTPELRDRLVAKLPELPPEIARHAAEVLASRGCGQLPLADLRALVEAQNRADKLGPPDFVVVAGEDHPVNEISRKTLARIFLAKVSQWDGRPVAPVDLSPRSPVRKAFSRETFSKSVSAIRSYLFHTTLHHVPPQEVCTEQEALAILRQDPTAISYVSEDAVLPAGVRVVAVIE
ncbi:MAG: HEAT repeat domain-containing protein [Acidobacteriota bacterium]